MRLERSLLFAALALVSTPALAIPPSLDVPEKRTFNDRLQREQGEPREMESEFEIKGEIKKEKSDLVVCSEGAAYGEELEDALSACDAAVVEKPEDGDIRYYRGFVLFHMERYSGAEAAFTKAIDLNARKKAESYYQRGVCKEKQRRLREAAGNFKKAADLKPEWSAARRKVKEYYWALGEGAE